MESRVFDTLLCFGDSNTYGWDPRDYFGGRYDAETRWTDRLETATGLKVVNAGVCGRMIPAACPMELRQVPDTTRVLVMLGSNDLLSIPNADAELVTARLRAFLEQLPVKPLVIAPPPMARGSWTAEDEERLLCQSARLGESYRALAEESGLPFADAGAWKIPLAFDGVHFTEEGHRRFAEALAERLRAE